MGSAEIQESFSVVRITSPLCQDTSICIKSEDKVLPEFSCGCIYQTPLEKPQPQEHMEDLQVHAVGMLQEWEHSIAGVPLRGLQHIIALHCKTSHSSALTDPLLSQLQSPELKSLPDDCAQRVNGHKTQAALTHRINDVTTFSPYLLQLQTDSEKPGVQD